VPTDMELAMDAMNEIEGELRRLMGLHLEVMVYLTRGMAAAGETSRDDREVISQENDLKAIRGKAAE